jgi:FKBP-type peptidyl-prolyl cis-trans isomerase SlyD
MRAQIVSFHCVLTNRMGRIISSTFNQDVITQADGQRDVIKGLAEGLKNLTKGEKRRVELSADQAYGFYDTRLVLNVPRNQLHEGSGLGIGDEVTHPSWNGGPKVFRVIQTDRSTVTLDGNHPLAGQDLIFDIEATEARDATSEEVAESCLGEPAGGYLH